MALARLWERRNERGDPKAAPNARVVVMSVASLPFAGNVISWVQDGDVFALDLERRRFWFVGPPNDEVVFVDAGDDAYPPTIRPYRLFPNTFRRRKSQRAVHPRD